MTTGVEMTVVFVVLFLAVTVMGFLAARWQRSGRASTTSTNGGLGGRKFGSWITGSSSVATSTRLTRSSPCPRCCSVRAPPGSSRCRTPVILYPMVFLPVAAHVVGLAVHGYVTPADFVRGSLRQLGAGAHRRDHRLVATMPYIALQLVGLEAVLRTMGLNAGGFFGHLPLLVAFVILAVYTYQSGLRAPALIAFVKGHPHLPGDRRRGVLPAREARRLGSIFSAAEEEAGHAEPGHRPAHRLYPAHGQTTSSNTSRWRSARRWRCSSTRTRSPACWPAAAAT
jgi:hypothetical protein